MPEPALTDDRSVESESTSIAELAPPAASEPEDLVLDELLLEDISIDGMCGVY
jgi:mycofactocin precursor